MVPIHEQLYVKASDLAVELNNAGKDINNNSSFIIIASLNSNDRPFGSGYVGGNNELLHDSLINFMMRDESIYRLVTEAAAYAMYLKNEEKGKQ